MKNSQSRSRVFLSIKLVTILFTLAFGTLKQPCAQMITLEGTITDPQGAKVKGAKVSLLGRKLTVLTDANGQYHFSELSTNLPNRQSNESVGGPKVLGSSLKFSILNKNELVRISLHALSGKWLTNILSTNLGIGDYQVNPVHSGIASGQYFLRVEIGTRKYALSLSYVNQATPAQSHSLQRLPVTTTNLLKKISADPDTLSVIAVGFERGERIIASLNGTENFKLNALKFANILYKSGNNLTAAEKSSCILDIRLPKTGTKWPAVLHFHGGGLTGGDRNEAFSTQYANFGQKFLDAGVIEISPGYRLIGQGGTWPDYIRDAAQAAIWIKKNIEVYGGDPNSIFISGFSAGAYLTHMLAIDSTWWHEAKFDPKQFAGFISISGQTRSHANLQADLKVNNIMAEKPYTMAMGHIHKTTMPWQIFVGGDEGNTVTDNQNLYNALIKAGSTDLYFDIIPNQPHTVGDMGALTSIKRDKFLAFINKYKAK